MRRLRNDLLDLYWWFVDRGWCPCSWRNAPDWAHLLCRRLDALWWTYRDPFV